MSFQTQGARVDLAGGHVLQLLPQRAAHLPAQRCLLVADAHFGKAASFRRLGVPVPEATTAGTLARLSAVLAETGAERVAFLGDLLHSADAQADDTVDALWRWRQRHRQVDLLLVRGNHDRQAGDPPPAWGVRCVDEPWRVDDGAAARLRGLVLAHHPEPRFGADADAYVLAGHLHPGVALGGRAHDRLRLPCFHFGPRVGVLPAFGEFTGLRVLRRAPGDRVFVVQGARVWAVGRSAEAPC